MATSEELLAEGARAANNHLAQIHVLACAVADAWAAHGNRPPSATFDSPLWAALEALESATRESPLRKIRP